ncbi:MAG: alpha/beta fold hydrolase [Patescibacteria group bacterium]
MLRSARNFLFFVVSVMLIGVSTWAFIEYGGISFEQGGATQLPRNSVSNNDAADSATHTSASDNSTADTIQEPDPFAELTIPHLRARQYVSQLGMRTQLSQNASYTSYLTSYQSDDLRVNGLVAIPAGETPDEGWPAVVFVHGYIPPALYQTTERYESYVDYLARNGFVVFKIDLRGHGDSEGEPGGAYYSGDYVIDVLNARAALQAADFVADERIGLWGHSMAGNVVLRSMAARPEIRAGVIWAGAVFSYEDWERYGLSDNSYRPPSDSTQRQRRRSELMQTHGSFNPESSFWRMVAPTNFLDEFEGAVQLHHTVNDPVVDVRYSRDLEMLLSGAGVSNELHEYASGGHDIEGSAFSPAMQRTVEFFEEWL